MYLISFSKVCVSYNLYKLIIMHLIIFLNIASLKIQIVSIVLAFSEF